MNGLNWNMPWLLLLALQPYLLLLLRRLIERDHLNQYVQVKLQPWVSVRSQTHFINNTLLRNSAYCLAWLLFAVAAAGPRIAENLPGNISDDGKDIMVVLDISQSMQATDLVPTRLRQAQQKIGHLINTVTDSRIGIIVYAAKAHLFVPATFDKGALHFYLRNLELLVPPTQGSRPSLALRFAARELNNESLPNLKRSKSILHITDADTDENETRRLAEVASLLSDINIPVFTLLLASNNGEAVPAFRDGWLDIDGRPVISRPKIKPHQSLSSDTGGDLSGSFTDNSGIANLIKAINNRSLSSAATTQAQKNRNELFPFFLLPAILLLFISISPYKLFRRVSAGSKYSRLSPSVFIICLLVASLISTEAKADQQDTLRNAYSALLKQDYSKARELYSSVNHYSGRYGEAVASYRLEDYPRAIRLFEQAVLLAESNLDFTNTLYNLGNSYFQSGNYALAIESFEAALLYHPDHQPSKLNMIYARRALQAVEERRKILATTTRTGRGPRTARAADNTVINENSSISLDSNESENVGSDKNIVDSQIDIPEFVILKGLEFAKESGVEKQYQKPLTAATRISQVDKVYDDQAALWRRIFEIEEGYPAPLEEPQTMPGILPW